MVVYVQNRGPSPKGDEDDDSGEPVTTIVEAPEHIEHGLLTPTSSVEQAGAPLTTPIDTMGRSISGNFSMPDTISFEGPPRHDRAYYTTPPQYTDSFSQPMLSTPVSAEIISPHDVSVFDYASSGSFPTTTPEQQRTAGYDSWSTPTFRQNIFSPENYSAPSSGHGLPPPSMPYHMPMVSPTHLHDMDPMNPRALPFRTGSMGHPHGLTLSHPV